MRLGRETNRIPATIAIAIVASCMGSQGCGSAGPLMYSGYLYLDTSEVCCGHKGKTIDILQEPPDSYVKVAFVEVHATFYADGQVDWGDLRNELCRQAIEANADAIIQLKVGSEPFSREVKIIAVKTATGGGTKKLTGIAIRYDNSGTE